MADAMFGALTNRGGAPADQFSAARSSVGRASFAERRDRLSGQSADPSQGLRAWLTRFSALLEPPLGREQVAAGILCVLEDFFPARQSALFVLEEKVEKKVDEKFEANGEEESDALVVAAARGTALSLEEAVWVERTARESLARCQVLGREFSDTSLSSFLWVPVLYEGRRVGVIELGDCRGHWFSGGRTRELSVLADDVGRLLVRLGDLSSRETRIETLQKDLSARTRECKEMERRLVASAGRDAISQLAISIAERSTDPSAYVLSNLQSARDDIEAMQGVVNQLLESARVLVDRLPKDAKYAELAALREALAAAETSRFRSFLGDLAPLIEDVEEGASRLRSIGEDFRELALGDAAPMDWVDLGELIERTLVVVSYGEGREPGCEVRISELPPVRCQRMRIQGLLVSILGRAMVLATYESPLRIQAELRGSQVIIEVSVDGTTAGGLADAAAHGCVEFFSPEQARLNREIAEDHGGQISLDSLDDLMVIRLSLPIDRD